MKKEQIIVLMSDDGQPRGNVWKITAKKTDFYLDFEGDHGGGFHLSLHGPNDRFDGHRFHVKADRQKVRKARAGGHFLEHGLGEGHEFDGVKIADDAYLVARLRWSWDLQRQRFNRAARTTVAIPQLEDGISGKFVETRLPPNGAWDVDLVVSYGQPHWPDAGLSEKDDARLGPLTNSAGMWLTATSYYRSLMRDPTPEQLRLPPPRPGTRPAQVLVSGPGVGQERDMYWFVEGITSDEQIWEHIGRD